MRNHLFTLFLITQLVALDGYARGKIQNEDVKSLSDLTSSVLTTTGNLTSGNACIASPGSVTGLAVGQYIYDTTTPANVTSGTTIIGLPGVCSAGQINMSTNATGNATGDTLTFGGQASQLINDTKIWVTSVTPNQQLSSAISKGVLGGGSGSKNYLTTYGGNSGNGNFEFGSTTGWSLFNTTLTGIIPTGAISAGASSITTFAATSSSPLAGSYSLNTASSGAITAGQGFISSAFTVDIEDQAKVLTFKSYYSVQSGAANLNFSGTSSNTFAVYIYDVTNSAWIQPAGVYGITQKTGSGYVTGVFQTTSNSTQYQIAVVAINASGGASSIYWDDFSVGPQTAPMGPAMTDWVAYVPTFTGFGTPTNVVAQSRRIGGNLEAFVSFTSGTSTAVTGQITLGYAGANANVSIDTTKLNTSFNNIVGYIGQSAVSAGSFAPIATNSNQSYFEIGEQYSGSGMLTPTNGSSFVGNGTNVTIFVNAPIVGWSSNVNMSSDTDTRVVSAQVLLNAGSITPGNGNPIKFDTVVSDTHAAYSTSTGIYTVPVSGYYSVFVSHDFSTTTSPYLSQNGTGIVYFGTSNNAPVSSATTVKCNAGDTLAVVSNSSSAVIGGAAPRLTYASFSRLSGPAVVAATESVNASYSMSANSSVIRIPIDTKIYDSHNAGTLGASFQYTAPVTGVYSVSIVLTTNGINNITLYKNGSIYSNLAGTPGSGLYSSGSIQLKLNAGDYIYPNNPVSLTITGGAPASGGMVFSVSKIGN